MMANTWQGEFPWQNLQHRPYEGTAPVKSFPPNGYGLFDMAGNVWEWTTDFYTPRHPEAVDPRLLRPAAARQPAGHVARPVAQRRPAGRAVPARWSSKAARTCARRTTASATGRPPAAAVGRDLDGPSRLPLHRPAGRAR